MTSQERVKTFLSYTIPNKKKCLWCGVQNRKPHPKCLRKHADMGRQIEQDIMSMDGNRG